MGSRTVGEAEASRLAYDRWASAAGPWRRWMHAVPLLAPAWGLTSEHDGGRLDARARSLARSLVAPASSGTLIVLDVSPLLGARVAGDLARRGLAHPVLHIGRWPYREALLPAGPLLAVLESEARRLPRALHSPSATVVLDGERDRPVPRRPPLDRRADNRYEMSDADLPDLPSLLAADVRQVLLVSADSPERVAFANDVERRYAAGGLAVERRIAP